MYSPFSEFLSELIDSDTFNEKTESLLLKTVGGRHDKILNYMKSCITLNEYLLMDAAHVYGKTGA